MGSYAMASSNPEKPNGPKVKKSAIAFTVEQIIRQAAARKGLAAALARANVEAAAKKNP